MIKINPPLKGRQYHFNSIQEILDKKITNKENLDCFAQKINQKHDNNSKWFGKNISDAENCLKEISAGWGHGLKISTEMDEKIPPPQVKSVKRRNVKGPEGDCLDMNQVNRGELDIAWTKRKRVTRNARKRFTITSNICTTWNVHSEKQIPRGVACATLAKALIKAGHAVEVVAFMTNRGVVTDDSDTTTNTQTVMTHTIQIKEFSAPLDVPTLVSGVAMAGFYRTVGFKIMLLDPMQAGDYMGFPDRNATLTNEILGNKNSTIINVPPSLETLEDAEKWIAETTAGL